MSFLWSVTVSNLVKNKVRSGAVNLTYAAETDFSFPNIFPVSIFWNPGESSEWYLSFIFICLQPPVFLLYCRSVLLMDSVRLSFCHSRQIFVGTCSGFTALNQPLAWILNSDTKCSIFMDLLHIPFIPLFFYPPMTEKNPSILTSV